MNQKTIAVGVYKDPTIQKYIKEGVFTSSEINKLIVEELLDEYEAKPLDPEDPKLKEKIKSIINRRLYDKKYGLPQRPVEEFVKVVELAEKGDPSGIHPISFKNLPTDVKKTICLQFLGRTKTKEFIASMAEKVADERDVSPEQAAQAVISTTGSDVEAEEVVQVIGGGDDALDNVDDVLAVLEQATDAIIIAALIATGGTGGTSAAIAAIVTALQKGLVIAPRLLIAMQQEKWAEAAVHLISMLPIPAAVGKRIAKTLEKRIGKMLSKLGPNLTEEILSKGMKEVVMKLLKRGYKAMTKEDTLKRAQELQLSQEDIDSLKGGEPEEPGDEAAEEEPEGAEEALEEILDSEVVESFRAGAEEFINKFMEVTTLGQQSDIYRGVWDPVRRMANVFKGAEPSEEEEAALTDKVPDQQVNEEDGEQSVIATSRVIRRHLDRVSEILEVYDAEISKSQKTGKVQLGNPETLKKYGDYSPKRLLYKILKLVIQDINGLTSQAEQITKKKATKPEQGTSPKGADSKDKAVTPGRMSQSGVSRRLGLREQEAEESRSDKIKKVARAWAQAKGPLAKLSDTLIRARTDLQQRPDTPAPEKKEPQQVNEKAPSPESDKGAVANSAKTQAFAIYKILQPVKEYFPTANPLQSEWDMASAIDAFKEAIKGLTVIVEQVQGFKSDSQIPPSLLNELTGKLDAIKKTLMEYFGVEEQDGVLGVTSNEGRPPMTPEAANQPDSGGEFVPLDTSSEEAEEDKKQTINSTKDLYLWLRKELRSSELTSLFQKLQTIDNKIAKRKDQNAQLPAQPYQWYIDTFSKFWAYYQHYKAQKESLQEKKWLSPRHHQAIGLSATEMPQFMRLINQKDEEFAPQLSKFFSQGLGPLPRFTALLNIMKTAAKIIQGDPEKNVKGMLDDVEISDSFKKSPMLMQINPDEAEPIEEPAPEAMVSDPDGEFAEQLIKKLKPIIKNHFQRLNNG